jgi:uncharacterized protein YbjT (DUF2867 family)
MLAVRASAITNTPRRTRRQPDIPFDDSPREVNRPGHGTTHSRRAQANAAVHEPRGGSRCRGAADGAGPAQVVRGDLDDAASLERSLAGAWGAYAVQNTWEAGVEREEQQGLRLADVARKAGIQHYVYASVASAHRHTGIPHFENKWRVEERVRSLGLPSYTIIRPVFFMENFFLPSFLPAIRQGQLAVALNPNTVLQMIAVSDIGKYGAWAFENHVALNGRAIDIAGDQLTMPQTAETIGRAAKREVNFVRVPIAEVRKFSEDTALMLEWFDRVGYNADIAKESAESGVHPTKFADSAAKQNWALELATS